MTQQFTSYFPGLDADRWPSFDQVQSALQSGDSRFASWALSASSYRHKITIAVWTVPGNGSLLMYRETGEGVQIFYSISNGQKLDEHVMSPHGTLLPVGLFVSSGEAFDRVREFMDLEGKISTRFDWVDAKNLPPGAFPSP
jgi:hypothetical protein